MRAPEPVGDGVVDNAAPKEDENKHGEQATTLSNGSGERERSTHHLEHAGKQKVEERPHLALGSSVDVVALAKYHKTHVADVPIAQRGVRQRVAPDKPVENDERGHHHGDGKHQEQQPALGKPGVETGDAKYHHT